jgi:hypothetical protein
VSRARVGQDATVAYEYDAAGRLGRVAPSRGAPAEYRYDGSGQPRAGRPALVVGLAATLGVVAALAIAAAGVLWRRGRR